MPDLTGTRRKTIQVCIDHGRLQVEEDSHELGWDVYELERLLIRSGIHLTRKRVFPCDCEPCRQP